MQAMVSWFSPIQITGDTPQGALTYRIHEDEGSAMIDVVIRDITAKCWDRAACCCGDIVVDSVFVIVVDRHYPMKLCYVGLYLVNISFS